MYIRLYFQSTPTMVVSINDISIQQIACGQDYMLARDSQARVWAWGRYDAGQVSDTWGRYNTWERYNAKRVSETWGCCDAKPGK